MGLPLDHAVAGAPYAIDVLDEDERVGSPDEDRLELPPGSMLVSFEPGRLPVSAPIEEYTLHLFRALHLAVVADEASVAHLREVAPVNRVAPLHESFAWTHSVVRALDEAAMVLTINQMPTDRKHPLRFGGRSGVEAHGYPTWDGDSDLVKAGNERWTTEPMLMPVVNLSLGPNSIRFPLDPGDAVQAATFFLSRACLITAAAGNSGEIKGAETLSAWAQVPWVVGVGATDAEEGGSLLPRSSRGLPDQPETWPDVVACGISPIDPAVRGTSFAAPRVAYFAALGTTALLYLQNRAQRAHGGVVEGIRLLAACYVDRFKGERWYQGSPRLPVAVLPDLENLDKRGTLSAVFTRISSAGWDGRLQLGPDVIRRLLLMSARELDGFDSYAQGAGFISEADFSKLLTTLSAEQWLTLLGLEAYVHQLSKELQTLPFFDTPQVSDLSDLVRSSMQIVMIDYPSGGWKFRPDLRDEGEG